MLRRPIANTLRSSPSLLLRATAQQARLPDERPSPQSTEQKHALNVQSEQSQYGMTETHGQKTELEENAPGSMPFVYPPTWNSFGAFVGAEL
ncbi:hypothetical protein B9Z19DRAFT_1193298 [Tuber borchii]|uniref:Uncharacterized protein n=1 Tax=Tuber borchii TaxID=42251 RepID=A0A2T6ZSL4_TUBBO|nr:hypothetical protein B9Z19DRAFT_1193298 [Tuber borchii]